MEQAWHNAKYEFSKLSVGQAKDSRNYEKLKGGRSQVGPTKKILASAIKESRINPDRDDSKATVAGIESEESRQGYVSKLCPYNFESEPKNDLLCISSTVCFLMATTMDEVNWFIRQLQFV